MWGGAGGSKSQEANEHGSFTPTSNPEPPPATGGALNSDALVGNRLCPPRDERTGNSRMWCPASYEQYRYLFPPDSATAFWGPNPEATMRAYDWPAEAAAAERLERRAEAEAEAGDTDAWYPRREGRGSVKSCSSAQGSDDDDPFARLRSDSALTSSDEETITATTYLILRGSTTGLDTHIGQVPTVFCRENSASLLCSESSWKCRRSIHLRFLSEM